MDAKPEANRGRFVYNSIPKKVSRKDFNRYIAPYLKKPKKGPKPKLSLSKIFHYLLYILPTGLQWSKLPTRRDELHWTNVYKWPHRWSKEGSYQALLAASVIHLKDTDQLDVSIRHGEGSHLVVKKGGRASAIPDTSLRKAKRSLLLQKITDLSLDR
jgi:transposase